MGRNFYYQLGLPENNAEEIDGDDWTPIHHAIRGGSLELIRYLTQLGILVSPQVSARSSITMIGAGLVLPLLIPTILNWLLWSLITHVKFSRLHQLKPPPSMLKSHHTALASLEEDIPSRCSSELYFEERQKHEYHLHEENHNSLFI